MSHLSGVLVYKKCRSSIRSKFSDPKIALLILVQWLVY